MAIHRWGEGVWARAIAFGVVALFAVWGSAALYRGPAGFSTVWERNELLTAEKFDAAISFAANGGPTEAVVLWTSALPLSDALIGREVADDVGTPGRQAIARSGDKLSKEMISTLRDAELNSVPIRDANKQKVEERIVGVCTLDERVGSVKPIVLTPKGTGVTEENLDEIKAQLLLAVPPLGVREAGAGPMVNRLNTDGQLEVFELRNVEDVRPNDEFISEVTGTEDNTIAEAGVIIDEALYRQLKEQGILEVAVKADSRLPLTAATKAKLAGWHVEAGETIERETFWTRPLFVIPVIEWPFDGGALVCVVLALVLLVLGWRYCNRPSVVDHLIETQFEMKKVSWPTSRELVGSSLVVIAFIFVVAVFLFCSDVAFAAIAKALGIYPEDV